MVGGMNSASHFEFQFLIPHSPFPIPHASFQASHAIAIVVVVVTKVFNYHRNFFTARECPDDQEENIKLPIVVGALLLLFLTAVIVVYILSRFRRRQLTSYESLN